MRRRRCSSRPSWHACSALPGSRTLSSRRENGTVPRTGGPPIAVHRGHRLRLPGRRRQALASLHHAGRVRRPDRRPAPRCADGAAAAAQLPDAVKRIALAIEIFHKASLVHDDVEDDDRFRYGQPALHRHYGVAAAVNVGDYLIGLGYRLAAAQREALGAEATADILAQFADAHTRLCEGQGAELSGATRRTRA